MTECEATACPPLMSRTSCNAHRRVHARLRRAMRCGAEPKKRCAVGGLRIKVGNEVVSGIGVSGGPGIDDDEACAKAGIDKISAHLK
ncbi:hypothetical protein FXB40_17440 [Bradyrhizobium rifense]|uniref:Heme-binding protein n=2 Tax=Bradyrhizobium rifense TaxID=515499 RepID=A0A5D3KDR4_9BRAD|nr:hypothetical protein FXB40_17440 [Bradyrhizobium rifense]